MKKIIKTISTICLVLLMAVPMFMLAGCSKNYTIEIIVDGGNGGVFKQKTELSVIGKNTVDGEEKFEYFISPNAGYEIESITIDGENVEVTNAAGMYKFFEDIKDNHTVVVKFKPVVCEITFMCRNDADTEWVKVTALNSAVDYGTCLNLNTARFGGQNNKIWFKFNSKNQKVYIYNDNTDKDAAIPTGYDSNLIYVRSSKGIVLYTDLTVSELNAELS